MRNGREDGRVSAIELLRSMMLIRAFEAALMARPDHGFQLLSAGQEAVSVGLCAALEPDDQLLSSGRSIGPALARGLDPGAVMAELLGKVAGPCHGKGGRGHLAAPAQGFFGAHAVVGGNFSIAAGVALAAQLQGRPTVVACLFGDGACGAGALHETLNIAALWKLPLVLVCDNNQMSVSTPRTAALAPARLSDLAAPFGVPGACVDGMDVLAVRDAALSFVERARAGHGPSFLECRSERFASHSSATRETRPAAEMKLIKARCPIEHVAGQLEADGELTADLRARLDAEVRGEVDQALAFADASPYPDASEVLADVG
jgi:TPP-dependent pyruvate/acetoin dehydrogenase alpha subunit